MLVKEIMVKKVLTVKKKENVLNAFSKMMKNGVRHLPVMDKGKMIGMITDRDIRHSVFPWKGETFDKDLFLETHKTLVDEIMTHDVMSVSPDTTIEEAAHILQMHKIGSLPVLKNEKLKGIITKSDIIDIFIAMMEYLQQSSRIDVVLDDDPDEFETVEKIIKKNGGKIISVGKSPSRGKHKHVNFFRIKRCNTDSIVTEIKRSGYRVESVL